MKLSLKASLMLALCAAVWGLTFPLIANAMKFINPSLFVTLRVMLAAIVFLPFIISRLRYTNKYILWGGVTIGLLTSLTYIFQSIGLMTLPSARSAFITGTNIVFVPLLMPLFRLGYPTLWGSISALLGLLGLYILTGANLAGLSSGDYWTLGCALAYALLVLCMQWFTLRIQEYRLFAFMQIIFTIPFAAIATHSIDWQSLAHPQVIIALVVCALFATCLVFYWQTKYQQHINPAKAALIFALEPVFATFFAFIINGEKITLDTMIGGGLILFSIVLADLIALLRKQPL